MMYYHVLSEKEIEEHRLEREEWWDTLNEHWKLKIHNAFLEFFATDYRENPDKFKNRH